MLLSLPLSLPSQVTQDFATFDDHGIGLVFLCELHKNHHNRATLPPGWQRIGAGEFQLAMAPGWTIHNSGLRRAWPDAPEDHPTKGWRVHGAGGCCGGGMEPQETGSQTPGVLPQVLLRPARPRLRVA